MFAMAKATRSLSWLHAVLITMVLAAAFTPGCSCGGDTETPSTSSGAGSSSSGGQGGSGGSGGAGGAGGSGGGMTGDNGVQATETVSGGQVSKSTKYKMIHTLGQPTQNQGTSTSGKYQVKGGLIGATEGK